MHTDCRTPANVASNNQFFLYKPLRSYNIQNFDVIFKALSDDAKAVNRAMAETRKAQKQQARSLQENSDKKSPEEIPTAHNNVLKIIKNT